MPNGGASLLLLVGGERRRHLRVAIVGDVGSGRELSGVVELLLVMVMCLLRDHVVLLVRHLDGLRRVITVAVVVAIRGRMLRMRHELMVLVEGGELHGRSPLCSTTEGRWVRERQWGRFWTFSQFSGQGGEN